MSGTQSVPLASRVRALFSGPRVYIYLAALLILILISNLTEAPSITKTNAVYLWTYSQQVLESAAEQDRFFEIADEESINTVYIQLNGITQGLLDGDENKFQSFIGQAKSSGMEVHALISGNTSALDDPDAHRPYVQAILKYNLENPGYAFEGINWDIEPVINQAPKYTGYMKKIKDFSFQGQNVASQNLTLSAYLDAPQWLGEGAADLYREFDIVALNSYGDTIQEVIGRAADGPNTLEKAGADFLIGIETDEINDDNATLYEEGLEAYHMLATEVDDYYSKKYKHYAGQYVHHYDKAISWWHMIVSARCPSGFFEAGEWSAAQVLLKRSDSYSDAPIGVRLTVSGDNVTLSNSRIVVLGGTESKRLFFCINVPAAGYYRTEISTWDLDLGGHGSELLEVGLSGDESAIKALTMEQLAQMDVAGKRDTFILLESTTGRAIP